ARSSLLLPYGDVFSALGRERRAVPVRPALTQLHSGQPRHQVELGRRDRPERDRQSPPLSVDEREVVRDEPLRVEVELVHADVRVAQVEHLEPLRVLDADLDYEAAAW